MATKQATSHGARMVATSHGACRVAQRGGPREIWLKMMSLKRGGGGSHFTLDERFGHFDSLEDRAHSAAGVTRAPRGRRDLDPTERTGGYPKRKRVPPPPQKKGKSLSRTCLSASNEETGLTCACGGGR